MPDDPSAVELPAKLARPFLEPHRYKIAYGGRGGAKSWGIARLLLKKAASEKIRILCTREIQNTIADSVHHLLDSQIAPCGLQGYFKVTENSIVGQNGSEFIFKGLRQQSVQNLKSLEAIDIAWVEEGQTITDKSLDVLIPTVRKEKSEIWMSFNPELDSDPAYRRFVVRPPKDSVVVKMTWHDNPWFPDVLRKEMEEMRERDPEGAKNIWDGECRSAVEGAIYAKEITRAIEERRIKDLPIDPVLRVHTVWDLGWNDQTSIILVQRDSSAVRIVGYIEDNHRTLADYASQLNGMRLTWGTDYLPHDGTAKNLQTGKTPQEVLAQLRPSVAIVPNIDVESGIKAARLMFSRCYFDETKTGRLIECLKRYRRAINVNTQEPQAPLHDEYSHAADAFRYLGVVVDQMKNETRLKPIPYKVQGIV